MSDPQPLQIMLDLETMGVGVDAPILSIGAVLFSPTLIVDSFYVYVGLESNTRYGRKMDASTVLWWMSDERSEARAVMLSTPPIDLPEALDGFTQWFGVESMPVWGNGASFDNVILRSAFAAVGEECPWKYSHDRCYRTVKALAPEIALQREGTHHNALDDARSQATHLQAIMMKLGIGG